MGFLHITPILFALAVCGHAKLVIRKQVVAPLEWLDTGGMQSIFNDPSQRPTFRNTHNGFNSKGKDNIKSRSKSPFVEKFSQENELKMANAVKNLDLKKNPFSSILLRGVPMGIGQKSSTNRANNFFHWEPCTSDPQIIVIKSLNLLPDPLHFPGMLNVSFEVQFLEDISYTQNITVNLALYAKVGAGWIEVPCMDQLGSCVYHNFCEIISGIECPQIFDTEDVPCKCPFEKGTYKIDGFTQQVDVGVLAADSYKANVVVTSATLGQVGCYNVTATII